MTDAPEDPFAEVMASLDAPMVIVTTAVGGERSGCLVGFHSQSSIDPQRCAVWISKANHTYGPMTRATHFAVHFLADTDRALARLFGTTTGDDIDKFARCASLLGPHDVPVLADCRNWFVARRVAVLDDGGDHVCFTGQPTHIISSGRFTPLRSSAVADFEPGHAA